MLVNDLNDSEADDICATIISQPNFILLILIASFQLSMGLYSTDNFKSCGYQVVFDDTATSTFLSISSFASLGSKIMAPYVWGKLKFYQSFMFCFLGNISMTLQFLFWGSQTGLGLCLYIVGVRIFLN